MSGQIFRLVSAHPPFWLAMVKVMANQGDLIMSELHKIKIAMTFDDWARVSSALADSGHRDRDGFLLALAAVVERAIGNTAVSGALEVASQRAFAFHDGP